LAYPVIYDVTYSYTGFQLGQGNNDFPGTQLDADLAGLSDSVENIRAFLEGFTRSDGRLANGSVGRDQLDATFQIGFSLPSDWAVGATYTDTSTVFHDNKFWQSNVAHVAGAEFDASKFDLIVDFGEQATLAAASAATATANAAQTTADRAQTGADRTAADASATSAAASAATATANAAQTTADRAQTGADRTAADASATSAATSATEAAASASTLTFASQAEAEAGTVDGKGMSPLLTTQAMTAGGPFDTHADVGLVNVPGRIKTIRTLGRDSVSDGIETRWDEVFAVPSHNTYLQDAGGRVFSIITRRPDAYQFGADTTQANWNKNVDALQRGLAYCTERGLSTFEWPNGTFGFPAHPGNISDLGPQVHIKAAGQEATTFYRNYNEVVESRGLFNWTFGMPRLSDCTIIANTATAGGAAIGMNAVPGVQGPGYAIIERVRITAGPVNGWRYGIFCDGQLDNTDPRGNREIFFNDVDIFGCEVAAARLVCVTNLRWRGFVTQFAGEGPASADIQIVGLDWNNPSHAIRIDLSNCDGNLIIGDYVSFSFLSSGTWQNINNTVNNIGNTVIGNCAGVVQQNWDQATNRHINSGFVFGSNATGDFAQIGDSHLVAQMFKPALATTFGSVKTFPRAFGSGPIYAASTVEGSDITLNSINGSQTVAGLELAASGAGIGHVIAIGRK
jgi:hypothetical protein